MVQPFTINLHLPNAMRVAIGDVTAQWSFLEYQIGQIIHELLKLDPKQGRIVTTQLNLRPQLEMIDLLFSTNKTDELIVSNFHKISDAIAEMQPERNMVVHDLWSNAKGSTEHHLVSYHGKKERRIVGKAVPMTETKI